MDSTLLYGFPLYEVTRPFFLGFRNNYEFAFPLFLIMLFLLALLFVVIDVHFRKKIWLVSDKPKKRKISVKNLIKNFFLYDSPERSFFVSFPRKLLFAAVIIYSAAGLIYFFNYVISKPFFSFNFLFGFQYLAWTFLTDTAGLLIFGAVLIDMFVRYIVKPRNLKTDGKHVFFHFAVILILTAGYSLEALRIIISGFPQFEQWSYVGYNLARLMSLLPVNYTIIVYTCFTVVFVSAVYILIARAGLPHMYCNIYPVYNTMLSDASAINMFDEYVFNNNTDFSCYNTYNGAKHFIHLSSDTLRSIDGCTECGLCDDVCPAVLSETTLSPCTLISAVKREMTVFDKNKSTREIVPDIINSDTLYACYDCGACNEVCPSKIRPLSVITELKKNTVVESKNIPEHITDQYRNIETYGTIYQQINEKNKDVIGSGLAADVRESTYYDYLLFIGCFYSNNENDRSTLFSFLKICKTAGLRIGVLGENEKCCGDLALRSGNSDLFFQCASYNLTQFRKYGINKIITLCPHGYNTLKKEYGKVSEVIRKSDEFIEVFHYTEILNEILQNKKKDIITGPFKKRIVLHDSCFLGRFNDNYIIPRDIIDKVPETDLREMNHHGKTLVCCGFSGSCAESKKRIAYKLGEFRAMEAVTAGADIVAVTCPYCEKSIREGLRDIRQDHIEVLSVIDIISRAAGMEEET